MPQSYTTRALQPLAQSTSHRVGSPEGVWQWASAIVHDADLRAVIIFVLIGLLASLCLTLLLPLSAATAVLIAQMS